MVFSRILIIIQRSNGDVLLSASLLDQLYKNFNPDIIDLLVNDDTIGVAKTLPFVNNIITFSYRKKQENRFKQEKNIIKKIYRKYDLSINLTASDRSVIYALLASSFSISAVESQNGKSWWKKLLLKHYYDFDNTKHILLNNLEALYFLNIKPSFKQLVPQPNELTRILVKNRLEKLNIKKFIIFHPSAQYKYKIFPKRLREELLSLMNQLNFPIIITGGTSEIDNQIKHTLPEFKNITNWIGQTSIEEFIALSGMSEAYIGMDTLNMHIAAGQNKRIFAIFGPTILSMWSPWSNLAEMSAQKDSPMQSYGNVTIFQANMPCVACGNAGCDNKKGNSDCLDNISPAIIYKQIEDWGQATIFNSTL